ncbi:DUF2867 domain-containing protein [Geodermatophilus sp. SYSU D01180]
MLGIPVLHVTGSTDRNRVARALRPSLRHSRLATYHRCCPRGRHARPGAAGPVDRTPPSAGDSRTGRRGAGSAPAHLSGHRCDRLRRRPAGPGTAGIGLRRGRRDPADLDVGDALDRWQVEELDEGSLLRLRAEMRAPAFAWLEFHVERADDGRTRPRQKATSHPCGLLGQLHWWGVSPFHGVVFGSMVRNLCRAAEAQGRQGRDGDVARGLRHRPHPAVPDLALGGEAG